MTKKYNNKNENENDDIQEISLLRDDSGLSLIDEDGLSDRYESTFSIDDEDIGIPNNESNEWKIFHIKIFQVLKSILDKIFSKKNVRYILRILYQWSTWALKFFSCYFCLFLVFVLFYSILFWGLTFRLILLSRSYSHQGVSHPLSLDLSKPEPTSDILVRQKWFIRQVHHRSTVKLSDIHIDFTLYKGWNITKDRFTVDFEILDRYEKVIWDTKKSTVLPPSIMKLTKPRKWKLIPLLTSSENIDETTQISVYIIHNNDFSELETVNNHISTAHLLRVKLDTNEVKIVSARLHITPILSGYAYMIRHQLLLTIIFMSIGLLFVVSCCYGATVTICCCFCLGRKSKGLVSSNLTEASWSRSTFHRLKSLRNQVRGNSSEEIDSKNINDSLVPSALEDEELEDHENHLDLDNEQFESKKRPRIEVQRILSESESDDDIPDEILNGNKDRISSNGVLKSNKYNNFKNQSIRKRK